MDRVEPGTRPAASLLLIARTRTPFQNCDFRVLMIQRTKQLKFLPDVWAFPGGAWDQRYDQAPSSSSSHSCPLQPLALTAIRETTEEVGISRDVLLQQSLTVIAHWITPKEEGTKRRFDTWFFLAQTPSSLFAEDIPLTLQVGEVAAARWLAPAEALQMLQQQIVLDEKSSSSNVNSSIAAAASGFRLAPPQAVLLHCLSKHHTAENCIRHFRSLHHNDGDGNMPSSTSSIRKEKDVLLSNAIVDRVAKVEPRIEMGERFPDEFTLLISPAATAIRPQEQLHCRVTSSSPLICIRVDGGEGEGDTTRKGSLAKL